MHEMAKDLEGLTAHYDQIAGVLKAHEDGAEELGEDELEGTWCACFLAKEDADDDNVGQRLTRIWDSFRRLLRIWRGGVGRLRRRSTYTVAFALHSTMLMMDSSVMNYRSRNKTWRSILPASLSYSTASTSWGIS